MFANHLKPPTPEGVWGKLRNRFWSVWRISTTMKKKC